MNPEDAQRDRKALEIFGRAVEFVSAEARAGYLEGACGEDATLKVRVEALLANHVEDNFLQQPAASLGPVATAIVPITEKPGDRIGRYKLLQQIGEGGCGVVYMAEQEEPVRRRVALKVIKLGMDTKSVIARFEAERQALAMMDHPNIAKVLDAGATDTGRPYFVMELVRGVRVTEYCDENNLPTRERLDLFIKVCQAIQHAHQKGVIHRDIKPSNILVTINDDVPVPKVIDFGIAKATEQRLTQKTLFTEFQSFIGTPAYMSPEQAVMTSLDIDTRSDIYALGVLLYELLTGRTPFDAKELLAAGFDEMCRALREKEPVRPSTRLSTMAQAELTATAKHRSVDAPKLAPLLRGDLDWIVMKCLEKDRTRRYETANGLAMDLKRHLNNEPVVARPPSAAYRFQKAFRRNKLMFGAAAAVAIALIVGLGVAAAGLRQALKERNSALVARAGEEAHRREAQQAQDNEAQLRRVAEVQELVARRQAYASDMNLVQQSITLNNFGRAQELLNQHRPATKSEIDLRGWEWRYLWQFCQSDDLFTLCRQTNSVFSLASSQDGRWLALGEYEKGGLSIWDLRTRQEIARLTAGASEVRAAFSPRGPLLAFSSRNQAGSEIQLWNALTRRSVGTLPLGGLCMGLTFAEDGQSLATFAGRPDFTLTLWSVPDGEKLVSVPLDGRGGTMRQARYSTTRDLRLAAYALSEGRIRVIDLTTGRERWTAKAAQEFTMALTFSPDGKVLASSAGYAEGAIHLWDGETGRPLGRLEGHQGWVASLEFWPDGKTLASASADQTIRLWDVADPARARPLGILRGHNVEVWSLALLPDNVTLVSGGKDGSVRVWDTTKVRRDQSSTTLPVKLQAWRFAPDSLSLIALDVEGRITRWKGDAFQDAQTLAMIESPGRIRMINPSFAVLSRDGRRVATSSTNGIISVWDVERQTLLRELPAQSGLVAPVAFLSRADRLLVTYHADGSQHEWDLTTGRETQSWRAPNPLAAVAISPDERWSVSFGYGGESLWWDRTTHTQTNLGVQLRQPEQMTFSRDGKFFAVVSELGIGKVWSMDPLREVGTLRGFLQGVCSVAFSADGSRIAAGSDGKEAVKLWDTASYRELLTLEAEGSGYRQTDFSPDGNILGAMNGQGILRLWRAPSWEEIEKAETGKKEIKQL